MSGRRFTGERLHEGSSLFALDLARHRTAYELALPYARDAAVLDLGCGSGHGAHQLARSGARVVGVDRVAPDTRHRGGARFLVADLGALPLREHCFDLIVSFQVIEHLTDPNPYLAAMASLLRPDGLAILTTPNRLTSDGVNPYHVHEYTSDELRALLARRFERVEMRGVGASPAVRRVLDARSARIAQIMRLDPLRLHERLPRAWLGQLFAWFAMRVRRHSSGEAPQVDWRDFPVGLPAATDLDLLALCREPASDRSGHAASSDRTRDTISRNMSSSTSGTPSATD